MDNFNLQGKVLIEKLDINTMEVMETLPLEENDISTVNLMDYFLNNSYGRNLAVKRTSAAAATTWNMYWSQSAIKQSKLINSIPMGGTLGSWVNVNVGSPFFTEKPTPLDKNYLTFVADILPDVSVRTIRSLGLGVSDGTTTDGSSYAGSNYLNLFTNLNLTTPCIQDTVTVIRITYRIYYDDPVSSVGYNEYSDGIYSYFTNALKYISDGSTTNNTPLTISPYNTMFTSTFYDPSIIDNYKPTIVFGATNSVRKYHDQSILLNAVGPTTYTNGMKVIPISSTLSDIETMGTFFRAITVHKYTGKTLYLSGASGYILTAPYLYKKIFSANVSPIKNVFKQISTAPGPFQDLSSIGTMTGTISSDTTGWTTTKLPKLVRIKITNTGDNTVAKYKYEVATFSAGFIQNTYNPREVVIPQDGWDTTTPTYHRKKVQDNQILDKVSMGGTTIRTPDDTKYFVATSCARTRDSISYYDIETGNKYILNSTTTPSLPVTNTSDMAVSNGYTFVTCSATGLWQISPDFTTVTHITSIGGSIDSSKAYQIDVKDNGDLWVLFEGGLAKGTTANSGVSWSWTVYDTTTSPVFSATGITNSNWANVISMVVDPEHANDRILFILGSAAATGDYAAGFIWWERLTGTTTIMTSGVPYPSFSLNENLKRSDLLKCSGGYWFTNANGENISNQASTLYLTTFGTNTWTTKTTYGGVDGRITPINYNNTKGILIGSSSAIDLNTYVYDNTVTSLYMYKYPSFFVKNTSISALPSTFTVGMAQAEFHSRSGAMDTSTSDLRTYYGSFCCAYPIAYLKTSNMVINYTPSINVFSFAPLIAPTTATNYAQYKGAFWKSYGWNGSAWELDHSGSKTCHSTFDTLLDGLQFKFNNGVSGTSFVDTESFIFVVGDGIMKDNATQIDLKLGLYPYESENITDLYTPTSGKITTVPSEIYGDLVDEPMTFREIGGNNINVISTKKLVSTVRLGDFRLYGCEEIPASTEFTIKFKLMSSTTIDVGSLPTAFQLLDSSLNYKCSILFLLSSGNLIIRDNDINNGSVIGTIPASLVTIDKEFKIVRYKNNRICFYYDNILYAAITDSSKMYPLIRCNSYNYSNVSIFKGFYDFIIIYTDYRRMALFGNSTLLTGKFHDNFVCTSVNNVVGNISCVINNIPQTILFNHSSSSVLAANEVRYEHGAGYLIFRNMPTITVSTSGSTTAASLYPVISGGIITSIVVKKNGSGYTSTPSITISAPSSGTTATATITLDATNSVNDLVTITNAGVGYTAGVYPLDISGGSGTGATGNVHISASGVVVNVEITNGGSDYVTVPSLSFTGAGSPSTPAVLTAAIGKRIDTITITDGGTGYIADAGTTVTANTVALYHP